MPTVIGRTLQGVLAAVLLVGAPTAVTGAEPASEDSTGAEETSEDPLPDSTPLPAAAPAESPGPVPDPAEQRLFSQTSVKLNRQDDNVVRGGPGDRFAIQGVYAKGGTFPVIAKSGDWYNIRLSETETGWIHSSLVEEYEDLSHLEFRPNPKLYSRVGSFVLTATVGGYSFDRKSNSLAIGARVGYYILSFIQAEGGLSWTHISRPLETVESLFGLRLEEEEFHMLFYNLNLTVEVLPGRQMVPFLTAGMGSTIFKGNSEPTFNIGAGTQLYLGRDMAMRWEVRNYRFTSGEEDSRHSNSNFEIILGTSFLL